MNEQELRNFLQQLAAGTQTPADEDRFRTWTATLPTETYSQVLDLWQQIIEAQATHPAVDPNLIKQIEARLDNVKEVKKTSTRFRWQYAAAIFIAVLATSLYFYIQYKNQKPIQPGGNRATLTLADGTKVELDSAKAGIQINDGNIHYNDGTKIEAKSIVNRKSENLSASGVIVNSTLLTLSTPKGGQYQIILSDGTKVWLNAASTLKYPSRFSGGPRIVELAGEAYFQIKEDKTKPFKVLSKNQTVEVLGTSFNISAFDDESAIKTTLVSGAIQVARGRHAITLSPGEQSTLKDDKLTKARVDITTEIAWKNGEFSFEGKHLPQVMNELSRWYNFEVTYQGPIPDVEFFGGLYRSDQMNTVLRLLATNGITYKLNGRRLTIIGKEDKP